MRRIKWVLPLLLIFNIVLVASGQEKKEFKFIGASGCKVCHMTKKSGAAYKIWKDSKHAQAYATLASEHAKAIAKEKGIEDPQKSGECLSCHLTAYGVEANLLGAKYKIEDGVGCETCHGPGSIYKSRKVKKGIVAGTVDPASVGLIKSSEEDCKHCHNEKSPSYKEFNFKEAYSKIAHTKPDKS